MSANAVWKRSGLEHPVIEQAAKRYMPASILSIYMGFFGEIRPAGHPRIILISPDLIAFLPPPFGTYQLGEVTIGIPFRGSRVLGR